MVIIDSDVKLSHVYKCIGSGATPSSDEGKWYVGKVPWVTTGELREQLIIKTKKCVSDSSFIKYPALKKYPKGSIVIAMYGATIGRLGILGVSASTNQACCVISDSKNVFNKYLFFCLQGFRENIISLASGGGQPNINRDKVASLRIPYPPLPQQQTIATYLDQKTKQLDHAIALKQQQIKLLKEYQEIMIANAVTKGLDPDALMQDSGVEWLGEIPVGWGKLNCRYIINQLTDYTANGSFADLAKNVHYTDIPSYSRLIRLTDFRSCFLNNGVYVSKKAHLFLRKSELKGGEFLIANVGAYAGLANIMPKLPYKCTLAPNMFKVILNVNLITTRFAFFLINCQFYWEYMQSISASSAQPKLNKENIRSLPVILPPLPEQKAIATYLDQKTTEIKKAINLHTEQIAKLKEYKTVLINNAVTGKIKITPSML